MLQSVKPALVHMAHIVCLADQCLHNLDRRPFCMPDVLGKQGPVVIRQQRDEHLALVAAKELLEGAHF